MKTLAATKSMHKAFVDSLRLVHSVRQRGVFVLSNDGSRFHSLVWSEYPVTSMHGPFIPRLHINHFSERLPESIATIWRVDRDALFAPVGLEVTVLETEIPALSAALPAVISHIEYGRDSGFEALLPFPTHSTTDTNIWSINASTHAKTAKA
jgi:hypothetical protein